MYKNLSVQRSSDAKADQCGWKATPIFTINAKENLCGLKRGIIMNVVRTITITNYS